MSTTADFTRNSGVIGHLGCFLVKSDFEIREFSYNFKFEISAIALSVNPGCPEVVSKVCHLLSRYEIRQCIIRCIALLYAFVGEVTLPNNLYFTHIGVEDGLCQNTVCCILQDISGSFGWERKTG